MSSGHNTVTGLAPVLDFTAVLYVVIEIGFFGASFLFYLLDTRLHPSTLRRMKLQPERAHKSADAYTWDLLATVLVNHLLVWPVIAFAFGLFYEWNGQRFADALPSFSLGFYQFFCALIWQDVFFYFAHRALHHPSVYGLVHKRHHAFTAPVALSAQYMHPLEMVVNFLCMAISCLYSTMHPWLFCFWFFVLSVVNASSHSGYRFRFYAPVAHDLHHQLFNVNFSNNEWMDILLGTHHTSIASSGAWRAAGLRQWIGQYWQVAVAPSKLSA